MISFAESPPEEPAYKGPIMWKNPHSPEDALPEHLTLMQKQICDEIHVAHQKHIDKVFAAAILKANGGVRPTNDELRQWCRTFVLPDGTVALSWKAPDYKPGDTVDLSYVIATVPPPMI